MDESHKEKMRQARAAAREARKNAVDAELAGPGVGLAPAEKYGGAEASEINALRAELAALKEKTREKAAHEHGTISGREKINDPGQIGGAEEILKESLRELIREQLSQTFPEREPVRKTTRESVRPGAIVAHDREGNPVYRKRDQVGDPFAVPDELRDSSYDLQWCRVSVHGQEDVPHQVELQEQGWRFVQADSDRWRGKMMPSGYKGMIYREGLALMERPMVLTEEARREASQKVKVQSTAQRQQFGMALPQGFSADTPNARANTFARQNKAEPTPSSLKPNLTVGSLDID